MPGLVPLRPGWRNGPRSLLQPCLRRLRAGVSPQFTGLAARSSGGLAGGSGTPLPVLSGRLTICYGGSSPLPETALV